MNSRPDPHRALRACRVLSILLLASTALAQRSFPPNPRVQRQADSTIQAPESMRMRVEDGQVFSDLSSVPLQKALLELADRTGIIFEVRSQDNAPVSVHLSGISISEAVERIAAERNIMFFYDKDASERISRVRVLPRTSPLQQPGLLYLGTGMVTKSSAEIRTPEQARKVLGAGADMNDRERALKFLVAGKSSDAIPALTHALSDAAPEIRAAAIEGLAVLNSRRSLPAILRSLKDEHPDVRRSAVAAVALFGTAGNVKDLKPLTSDNNSAVVAAAESAIRKLSAASKH